MNRFERHHSRSGRWIGRAAVTRVVERLIMGVLDLWVMIKMVVGILVVIESSSVIRVYEVLVECLRIVIKKLGVLFGILVGSIVVAGEHDR